MANLIEVRVPDIGDFDGVEVVEILVAEGQEIAAEDSILALESDKTPSELRRQVSSPGGTTVSGLARLSDGGFAEAISAAVQAASQRAEELGRGE